jgi:anti-sigma B factor antagonist
MSGPVVLRLTGEVDISVVSLLRDSWYATADQDAPPLIIVDLADVTFMDACGLGLLVGVRSRQLRHGGQVCLRGIPPCVRTLLQLTGLLGTMPLEDPDSGHLDGAQQHRVIDLRDTNPNATNHSLFGSPTAGPIRVVAD